jgi:dephospho-CoA kinase
MIVIGLTGSIGMGKSMAGSMLRTLGVPVHESDVAVHELLRNGSPAWPALNAAFPYFSYPHIYKKEGAWKFWRTGSKAAKREINRTALGNIVFANAAEREKLEAVLHPFVQQKQNEFIKSEAAKGRKIVALDIPLLFETGAETRVDYTMTVSAPPHVQEARVLSRPGMTVQKFAAILQRQMPDGEKCARSDFVVHSGLGRAHMIKELKQILLTIRERQRIIAHG